MVQGMGAKLLGVIIRPTPPNISLISAGFTPYLKIMGQRLAT
jgi:hypothetical protein